MKRRGCGGWKRHERWEVYCAITELHWVSFSCTSGHIVSVRAHVYICGCLCMMAVCEQQYWKKERLHIGLAFVCVSVKEGRSKGKSSRNSAISGVKKQVRGSPSVRQVPSHLDTLLPPCLPLFSSPSSFSSLLLCRLVCYSWRTHFTFQCVTPARHNTC